MFVAVKNGILKLLGAELVDEGCGFGEMVVAVLDEDGSGVGT
jgi:hypothetical protein